MNGYPAILLPGAVLPAQLAYEPLIGALAGRANCALKEAEIYSGDAPPADYSLDVEIQGVLRVAADAGFEDFHLVGYSLGGAIALGVAATHPGRLRSLALVEPAPIRSLEASGEGDAQWADLERAMALPGQERMQASTSALLKPGVPPPTPPPGPPPPWMASRIAAIEPIMRATWFYELDQDALARFQSPVYLALGSLSNPTFERQAGRLAELLPHLQVDTYEGRHHLDPPHRAEPERFARALLDLWAGR